MVDVKKISKYKSSYDWKITINKAKEAVKLFDYIHSLDNQKLSKYLAKQENILIKNLNILFKLI